MSLSSVAQRVARLETQRRFVKEKSLFTLDVNALDDGEWAVIQDAQRLLSRDGVLHDGELSWETLSPDERELCTRVADIILTHRRRDEDRHARMH